MKRFCFLAVALLVMSLPSVSYSQHQRAVKNLTAFAKMYGYIKYFHPSDEAYDLDWKAFASYGSDRVLKCSSDEELISALQDLFEPFAPTVKVFNDVENTGLEDAALIPKDLKGYELVFWQHEGVGFGMDSYNYTPYKSVRVNKKSEKDVTDAFGNLIKSIDAAPYANKRIKYSSWVQLTEDSEETGHLWFRVDNRDGSPGAFNNMGDNPIKGGEGRKYYEIIEEVGAHPEKLVFGALLFGKGTMLVDNIKMSYENNGVWNEIILENADFENISKEKGKIEGWRVKGEGYSFELTNSQDWNSGNALKIEHEGKWETVNGEKLFDFTFNGLDFFTGELVEGVFCKIPLTLYSNDNGTFPNAKDDLISKLKEGLSATPKHADHLSVRLGNVIQTFNVFQHFYPYFEEVNVDWPKEFEKAVLRSFENHNLEQHTVTLEKFTAPLKDGHIRIINPSSPRFSPPISWEWIENKLVITEVFDEVPISVGDIVTEIDGVPSGKFFEGICSRISAGTSGWLRYRAKPLSLLGQENSKMTVTVNGKDIELIRSHNHNSKELKRKPKKQFEMLDKEVAYLNIDVIPMDTINKMMPKLLESKAIICDLRGYPRNTTPFLSHLLESRDTTEAWMFVPRIVKPDRQDVIGHKTFGWELVAQKPYLGDKKIIFITDGRAISYAESYLGYVEGYNLATIVGQPTAGTNGNINSFNLSDGLRVVWTGMKVLKHDGSQHHAVGIVPDVMVTKTIKGIQEGRDEFLEKAMEIAKGEQLYLKN